MRPLTSLLAPSKLIPEAKDNSAGIASFTDKPWVNFTVLDYPPSVFINYEIRPDQVQPLSAALYAANRLPDGFVMKPLTIIESDPDPANTWSSTITP